MGSAPLTFPVALLLYLPSMSHGMLTCDKPDEVRLSTRLCPSRWLATRVTVWLDPQVRVQPHLRTEFY
jgi:hypothetical protein